MEQITFLLILSSLLGIGYVGYVAIWRLYFSPIAKFPGRKLAALTLWYEFYYDVVKQGSYTWEIAKMHEEFGPIVRINPYELHVLDASFMNELYPTTGKNVEKWSWSAALFGSSNQTFSTVPDDLHRVRRNAFNAFFSKSSIRRYEPVIQSVVDNLVEQLARYKGTGKPANLVHAYSAVTADVITEYCFSDNKNLVHEKDFSPFNYNLLQAPCQLTPINTRFPWFLPMMNTLPDWFVELTNPIVATFRHQIAGYGRQVDSVLKHKDKETVSSHPTIFHALRDDPELPTADKTASRLVEEAIGLVGAGTLTSSHTLAITTYHILANPAVLTRLLEELDAASRETGVSPLRPQQLEQLPYLTAVINEGLRVSYGISHRLQRVHVDKALVYGDWTIPPGTPVGMTSVLLHNDPATFPDPYRFDPERFLGPEAKEKQKHLLNFGKGTRQCVGINLAYAEIYLILATVLRNFGRGMKLFETDREKDVDVKHDFFVVSPNLESRGVRVQIE